MKKLLMFSILGMTLLKISIAAHSMEPATYLEKSSKKYNREALQISNIEQLKHYIRDNINYPTSQRGAATPLQAHIKLSINGDGHVAVEYLNSENTAFIEEIERVILKVPKLSLMPEEVEPFIVGFDILEEYQSASSSISKVIMPTLLTPYDARFLMGAWSGTASFSQLLSNYDRISEAEYSTDRSYVERIQRIYHARLNMVGTNNKAIKIFYPSAYIQEQETHRKYAPYHIYTNVGVTKQIALRDGKPYVEYLDWIVENIANIKGYDIEKYGSPLISVVHESDGKPSSLNVSFLHNKKFARKITKIFKRSPEVEPAELNGTPVRYKQTILFPLSRLKEWRTLSFSEEVKHNMANNIPIPLEFVDCLPTYNGGVIADFEREFTTRVKHNASSAKGTVSLSITLEKDGTIGEVDIIGSDDQKLKIVAINTLVAMPQQWTPAKVYGEEVACTIYLTISI